MERARPMTSEEAMQVHALAAASDPNHDQISCWCCCMDCKLNWWTDEINQS